MELPDLGRRCQHKDCGQLDFLPFMCSACSGAFCGVHRTQDAHDCSSKQQQQPVHSLSTKKAIPIICHEGVIGSCVAASMVRVECTECHESFCTAHRHPSSHNCQPKPSAADEQNAKRTAALAAAGYDMSLSQASRAAQMAKNMAGAKQTPTMTTSQLKLSGSTSASAKKVMSKTQQLVEARVLKMKATGDKKIPAESRTYMRLRVDNSENQTEEHLLFYDGRKPVGAALSLIQTLLPAKPAIIDVVPALFAIKLDNDGNDDSNRPIVETGGRS
ncbi:hypothetical protein GQ42DRAFT_179134 [Ramicandelaber brevisporus]|nr:hypothetical protein GQ42DRAFT_179134 [Ramicandelaber brevisporus]